VEGAHFNLSMIKHQFYKWVLLYWMPYDNNLWPFGSFIIQMLTSGAQSEKILVVVESDLRGAEQLSRRVITKGQVVELQQLDTANSGSEDVFAEYLSWAQSQFSAEKWAIVFLGHGGRLDEISPDEHSGSDSGQRIQWMNIEKVANIIVDFNRKINDRMELVFLQNCCKGTIETHYTFRDAAKYTLSSQTVLGAPNYYYEPLLQFLGGQPEINGGELAEKIMEFERSDMFNGYTVTNNMAVRNLPSRINPLIDSILSSNIKAIRTNELQTYYYAGDRLIDVVHFFGTIVNQSGADQQKYGTFIEFFMNSMIYRFQQSPKTIDSNLSGLSLFFPSRKEQLDEYCYLQVFSDLKYVKLLNAILFDKSFLLE